ncbi:MAG: hypothetical protein K8Q99_08145 [Acholeplasmataceae bacterium]|nr:hypothetical protein [Acholeplasmataceae bacterium]
MRENKTLKLVKIVMILILFTVFLSACNKKDDPIDPINENTITSLISDGVKWMDPTYVYAQDNGVNPLAFVAYDKSSDANPVLSKTIDESTEDYKKLVLSIKGQYYIQLNIISKKYEVSSETKQSFKIKLTDEYEYYEFDLADEDYNIFKDLIIRIEIIATAGASRHFGSFEINQFAFDKDEMTIESYRDTNSSPMVNLYETSSDTFDVNQYWYGYKHLLTISDMSSSQKVNYSILPGPDVKVSTMVDGDFSDYNYMNFRFKGDEGTKISITVRTTYKEVDEVLPTVNLELNGQFQNATLYLDELSDLTKDAINEILIYIQEDMVIPTTGQFEILKAEFSNEAAVGKYVDAINYYLGDQEDFSFNQLWYGENDMTASFVYDTSETIVTYEKQSATSAIYSKVEGHLSDFAYINVAITTEPYAEFLFQVTTRWSERLDHHLIADELGNIEFTMSFGLHYFDIDIDGIEGFRITPDVNDSQSSGSFSIQVSEFSNTADVSYDVTQEIDITDWMQIGNVFSIETLNQEISWTQGDGYETLYTRVYGSFVQNNQFYYKYIDFIAVVGQQTTVQFEVDTAIYELTLVPGQIHYQINLSNPTTGVADFWKFTEGFNLYLHINTEQSGVINLSSYLFTNDLLIID